MISRDLKLSSMRQAPDGGEAALQNSRATGSNVGCFAVVSLQQARPHKKKDSQTQWLSAGVNEIISHHVKEKNEKHPATVVAVSHRTPPRSTTKSH